jgi:hypothetical protein
MVSAKCFLCTELRGCAGSQKMATIKNRLERLEQSVRKKQLRLWESEFKDRTPDELDFFADNGYFPKHANAISPLRASLPDGQTRGQHITKEGGA